MIEVNAKMVKELRAKTGSGIMDCKEALSACEGDIEKSIEFLRKKGLASASKRADKETSQGLVYSYIHMGGKIGVLVEVNCESDFVAKTEGFQEFVKNVAMHIAAAAPVGMASEDIPEELVNKEREIYRDRAIEEGKPEKILDKIVDGQIAKFYKNSCLMSQAYIRNTEITIEELTKETIAKVGENVRIRRFARFQLGV